MTPHFTIVPYRNLPPISGTSLAEAIQAPRAAAFEKFSIELSSKNDAGISTVFTLNGGKNGDSLETIMKYLSDIPYLGSKNRDELPTKFPEARFLETLLDKQLQQPLLEQIMQQQVAELSKNGKPCDLPGEPSFFAMKLVIDDKTGEVTLHQTAQYHSYRSAEGEDRTVPLEEKPFVQIDIRADFSATGKLLKKKVATECNHSGENLANVFDTRSLASRIWDAICNLFSTYAEEKVDTIRQTAPIIKSTFVALDPNDPCGSDKTSDSQGADNRRSVEELLKAKTDFASIHKQYNPLKK